MTNPVPRIVPEFTKTSGYLVPVGVTSFATKENPPRIVGEVLIEETPFDDQTIMWRPWVYQPTLALAQRTASQYGVAAGWNIHEGHEVFLGVAPRCLR